MSIHLLDYLLCFLKYDCLTPQQQSKYVLRLSAIVCFMLLSVFVCFAVCVFFIENVFCSCLKEKVGALRVGGYDQPVGFIKVSFSKSLSNLHFWCYSKPSQFFISDHQRVEETRQENH